MYGRLSNFFETKRVLHEGKFGFGSYRSTTQAILLITDKSH
jgi:hypothetical protein